MTIAELKARINEAQAPETADLYFYPDNAGGFRIVAEWTSNGNFRNARLITMPGVLSGGACANG